MTPEDVVVQLGGTATRGQLLQTCTPREIRAAVTTGRILRLARGRFGSTSTGDAELARTELSGTLSCLSAAIHHGWEVAREPDRPWVAVPRNRKVRGRRATCTSRTPTHGASSRHRSTRSSSAPAGCRSARRSRC